MGKKPMNKIRGLSFVVVVALVVASGLVFTGRSLGVSLADLPRSLWIQARAQEQLEKLDRQVQEVNRARHERQTVVEGVLSGKLTVAEGLARFQSIAEFAHNYVAALHIRYTSESAETAVTLDYRTELERALQADPTSEEYLRPQMVEVFADLS
jgi:hypothetical protein